MTKLFIKTFGCQMNKLDSELILGQLLALGYEEADSPNHADVILFNTCSVRRHAEERVFSRVGALKARKRREPDLLIGVIGCMAQKDAVEVRRRLPHVGLVCGTRMLHRLPELIEEARRRPPVLAVETPDGFCLRRSGSFRRNTFQAFVAAMRGCDNFCSYCVVPYVRGREVSRPIDDIEDEAKRLVDDGCVEITLLGQNIDSYGKRLSPRVDLADLLVRLDRIAGLRRIRFVTSHPRDFSDAMISAIAELPSVCENVHLPPQSGSDRILKLMKRGYASAYYRDLAAKLRREVPEVTVAADFIVGFPTETDADFQQSCSLLQDVGFQNSFIFKYSPRPGTAAADMTDDVPSEEKARRNNFLLDLQKQVSLAQKTALVGTTHEVLVEGISKRDSSKLMGRARTNHIVVFEGPPGLEGKFVNVRVTSCTPLTLFGVLAPQDAS